MSTLKKHLISDVNHTIPTYKKLPPISSPTPTKGSSSLIKPITVAQSGNKPAGTALGVDGALIQGKKIIITSASQEKKVPVESKLVLKSADTVPVSNSKDSKNVQLIGYKKTSNELEKSPGIGWTPLGSELPPCKICGEKASGLHYGVYTCEACKAFFRRTLKRKNVDFQCTCSEEERKLGVDQPRKTTCPKCRYDRCLHVGMSKDAIKIGRYTINRKRQNDREVSMLKEQGKLGQPTSSTENSPASGTSYSPYSSGQSVSSPEELSSNITTLSLDESHKDELSAKRMRGNDYKGEGMLFRSLTNSIFMSLIENQPTDLGRDAQTQNLPQIPEGAPEVSPLENLYMQPFQPPESMNNAQQVLPSDVKFTPPKDQFSVLQMGGNSNPFSVPPKGGNHEKPVLVSQDIQGLAISENNSTFQFSPIHISDSLANSGDQNIAMNDTATLNMINQGENIMAQTAAENENSPIELLLQQPAELSPLSQILARGTSDSEMNTADTSSSQAEQVGLAYDHDAVVPTMTNTNLPSPLTEETNYNLDNITLPMEEFQRETILAIKSNDPLLDLQKGLELVRETEELQQGGGMHESFYDLDHQLEQFDLYQDPVLSPGKDISMEEINSIIAILENMTVELELGLKRMTCMEIRERHKAYLEQYRLKMDVFGQMSNITREEYITFYNQTGIDIDNRQEIIIEGLKYFEESIAKMVKFAKIIPGFSDINIEDQVNLMKSSRFPHEMINTGSGGNCISCSESEVTTTPWNKDYHIDELGKVLPKEFLEMKGKQTMQVYKMDLSMEELAVCRAMMITDPDQCALKDRQRVEIINNKIIACLCHLLALRPAGKKPLSLVEVTKVMMSIRALSDMEHRVMQEVFEMWPVSSNHTLLKEFYY